MKAMRRVNFRARLRPSWDSTATTQSLVSQILKSAKRIGMQRAVAQHLVAAALESRFPGTEATSERPTVKCDLASTDFMVGDTAFHVTDIPLSADFEKCLNSLHNGFRVYLLVPDEIRYGALLTADSHAPEWITVESIESFVARSVDMSSSFTTEGRMVALRALVEVYNARIHASGSGHPVLISLPPEPRPPARLQGELATP
jgi:hypothetical protein